DTGDHFAGGHRMLTTKDMGVSGANNAQKFPGIGAIVNREIGPRKPGMPGYLGIPHAASIGLDPGYFGGHLLGAQPNPFVTGPAARRAFDMSKEDPRLRDSYGRHSWGQSTLLARRLAEAGSTFVTVHFGGWDHHWDLKAGMENYLPKVDTAVAALFRDLD